MKEHSGAFESIRVFFCLFLATSQWGCGERLPPGPELFPVNGTVILDGKPLAGATVLFHPRPGTAGNGGFGVTDDQGKFTLTDNTGKPGCPAGEYGVTFSKLVQKDGSPVPPGPAGDQVDKKESIPRVYTVFNPYAIVQGAEVKAPSATFDFTLDSKLKAPPSLYE